MSSCREISTDQKPLAPRKITPNLPFFRHATGRRAHPEPELPTTTEPVQRPLLDRPIRAYVKRDLVVISSNYDTLPYNTEILEKLNHLLSDQLKLVEDVIENISAVNGNKGQSVLPKCEPVFSANKDLHSIKSLGSFNCKMKMGLILKDFTDNLGDWEGRQGGKTMESTQGVKMRNFGLFLCRMRVSDPDESYSPCPADLIMLNIVDFRKSAELLEFLKQKTFFLKK
ncbi:hypothetical protein FQA39_LY01635 [Lamprigera yunnana]|nr:hypothetical protein FQA39_LY01635 [Lamprigera yunnana]